MGVGTAKNRQFRNLCAIVLGQLLKKESLPTVASSMGHRQAYLAMHLGAEVGKRGKKCV